MQTVAVNQLITDQLTKFQFNGDNRLEFLSGFPEVAAHFGFTELIYGDLPMARLDIRDEGVELAEVQEWAPPYVRDPRFLVFSSIRKYTRRRSDQPTSIARQS